MVAAIVLAAGESTRMGSPKALLLYHNEEFIRGVIRTLESSDVSPIIVVLGAHAAVVQEAVRGLNVRVTLNHGYKTGQLSSLHKGLEIACSDRVDGILVHPVDHPAVRRETIDAILETFARTQAPVVVPAYRDRRGHPVLFSATVFEELKTASPELGARTVVWRHSRETVEVAVDDPGIRQNIDTREAYDILMTHGKFSRPPRQAGVSPPV